MDEATALIVTLNGAEAAEVFGYIDLYQLHDE
jgi:hypothetical protein